MLTWRSTRWSACCNNALHNTSNVRIVGDLHLEGELIVRVPRDTTSIRKLPGSPNGLGGKVLGNVILSARRPFSFIQGGSVIRDVVGEDPDLSYIWVANGGTSRTRSSNGRWGRGGRCCWGRTKGAQPKLAIGRQTFEGV